MGSPLSIDVRIDWVKYPSDHSKCAVCDQLIIGTMWQQVVYVDKEPVESQTNKVCQYCYNDERGKT